MEDMAIRFGPEPMTVDLDWCSECGATLTRGTQIYGTQKKDQPWRKTCVACVERYRKERDIAQEAKAKVPDDFIVTFQEMPNFRPRYAVLVNGLAVYSSNNGTGCREVERFLRAFRACAETAYYQNAPRWEGEV